MLNIVCPKCRTLHHAGVEHIGRLLKCAGCGNTIPVTRAVGSVSKATPTVIEAVGEVSPAANHTKTAWQRGSTHRRKVAWLGGVVVFLVLAVIAGIAYHRQQNYAAQLDKQVQDNIAKKKAETGLEPSATEAQQPDTPTSHITLRRDDNGQVFRPENDNQVVPSSSKQLVYIPDRPGSSEAPASQTQRPAGVRQPNRDLGIDIAEPVSPSIDLRAEPNQESAVIRTATRHNLLALIHRASKDGWYDVVDVHSGEEGWVRESDVRIHRTEHPQPEAKFSEEYVGTNAAPEVTVANQTSSTLTLENRGYPSSKAPAGRASDGDSGRCP